MTLALMGCLRMGTNMCSPYTHKELVTLWSNNTRGLKPNRNEFFVLMNIPSGFIFSTIPIGIFMEKKSIMVTNLTYIYICPLGFINYVSILNNYCQIWCVIHGSIC